MWTACSTSLRGPPVSMMPLVRRMSAPLTSSRSRSQASRSSAVQGVSAVRLSEAMPSRVMWAWVSSRPCGLSSTGSRSKPWVSVQSAGSARPRSMRWIGGEGVEGAQCGVRSRRCRGLGGLVQQDHAGQRDLVGGVRGCGRVGASIWMRVDHGDHGIEAALRGEDLVGVEGLDHRGGVGDAGGLDDDAVQLGVAFQQGAQGADQVAAHDAADAAGAELDQVFVAGVDQVAVDADIAEFVDDDGEASARQRRSRWFSRVVLPAPR